MVHGFLSFCEWFFTSVSPDGRYFRSPLRINGSALESIFSVLKHTSGGNLSAIAYSPALGRLINRKSLTQNKNSEKGYRDRSLNLDGGSSSAEDQIFIQCTKVARNLCQFIFPPHVAQSSLGGRQGSNACTIIAVKFGDYCIQHKLDISLLWTQLPQLWTSLFVNAICEPLPGVLGSRGAWAFIFRDIGRSSNYFQGLREPGFRFWGSREIKGTLIFRFFCSVPGLFTCRKAETDKCFSSLSIYKDNFHEGQLTSLTRAIRSLCVMQCIMGKLKHMARHSQDGGREWRQWSC